MSIITNQFNEVVSGIIDGAPSLNSGLLIAVNINQKKYLTHVNANVATTTQTFPYTTDNVLARLMICTGYLRYNAPNSDFQGPVPKSSFVPEGAGRIIYDSNFINSIDIDFSEPIFCTNDEILNICIGFTWVQGEVAPGITTCLGRLTALGYTKNSAKDENDFPYNLR